MGEPKNRTTSMPAPHGSGSFRVNLNLAEPSDPRSRTGQLRARTDSLRVQLDRQQAANQRLDSLLKGHKS